MEAAENRILRFVMKGSQCGLGLGLVPGPGVGLIRTVMHVSELL